MKERIERKIIEKRWKGKKGKKRKYEEARFR